MEHGGKKPECLAMAYTQEDYANKQLKRRSGIIG